MLFSVSGVEVHPLLPTGVAFVVSFFTSMGGVSGAFLLLPFQVSFLHYTAPSVSATNHVFNIVAIPSGVYRYIREGRMLWPLTWAVIIGTLPGVFLGAWIRIRYLPDPRSFRLFVGLVLLYLGWRLVMDIRSRGSTAPDPATAVAPGSTPVIRVSAVTLREVRFDYDAESFRFSCPLITGLCALVGIVGGIYGIGGGAIVAPFLVAILKLPVYAVAGAALMGTFVTSVAAVLFYHLLAQFAPHLPVAPDWPLGICFGLGGMLGMYLGAKTQRFVPARAIKGVLCACVLFVAVRYVIGSVG